MTTINVPATITPHQAATAATYFVSIADSAVDHGNHPGVILFQSIADALTSYQPGMALTYDASALTENVSTRTLALATADLAKEQHDEGEPIIGLILRELSDALWHHGQRLLWAATDPTIGLADDVEQWLNGDKPGEF